MVKVDELRKHCREVEEAVAKNPHCNAGLFGALHAYATEESPGRHELLALLHMSDEGGYWYGYIGASLYVPGNYVALIVRVDRFLNAQTTRDLLNVFDLHMVGLSVYHPCKIQKHDDAFAETDSFPSAVAAMIEMIKRFDTDKRDPAISSSHYMDSYELRCFDYFGFKRCF